MGKRNSSSLHSGSRSMPFVALRETMLKLPFTTQRTQSTYSNSNRRSHTTRYCISLSSSKLSSERKTKSGSIMTAFDVILNFSNTERRAIHVWAGEQSRVARRDAAWISSVGGHIDAATRDGDDHHRCKWRLVDQRRTHSSYRLAACHGGSIASGSAQRGAHYNWSDQ